MQTKQFRMIVDILMTLLSIVLMGGTLLFPSEKVHQILGMVLLVLWIVHTVLNRRWYTALGKGKHPPYRIMQMVVNGALAVCALVLMVSGLMMAWFMPVSFGMEFARTAHLLSSHWYYLCMGAHLGMHASMIFARFHTHGSAEKSASATFVKNVLLYTMLLLVCVYGLYAFVVRGVGQYLLLRQQFFFLDLERGYVLFVVDYLAILVLFAAVAYHVGKLLPRQHKSATREQNGEA